MKKLLIIPVLFSAFFLLAQEPQNNTQIIEDIVQETESDFELNAILEDLQGYRQNPLNLNTANEEQLGQLIILTSKQITSLINYRQWNDPLASVYELKAVPYFDLQTISAILPYVKVAPVDEPAFKFKNALKYGRHETFLRYQQTLETKAGYIADSTTGETKYLGNPQKYYARYRYFYGQNVSVGFTAEKDAGEPFFQPPLEQGFDFYSAHLFIRDYGKLQALAVGDYSLNFGQGLLMWTGFGYGKSPYALNIKRNSYPVNRYSSVNENQFFRGVASTVELGPLKLTAFGSRKKIDGNVETDTILDEEASVTSLQIDGLHRTANQLADRNSVTQSVAGGRLEYGNEFLEVGINGVYTHLDKTLIPQDRQYNKFDFQGTELLNGSVDYELLWRNVLIFGETAVSDNGKMATLNGLTYNLDAKTSIALLYRNYNKAYQTIYGSSFGESSSPQNEEGFYFGFSSELNSKFTVQAYADFFRFPYLRFRTDGPSSGQEYLLMLEYRPNWETKIYLRGRFEEKGRNPTGSEETIRPIVDVKRGNLRLHFDRKLNSSVSIRSRAELTTYQEGNGEVSNGFLIYQDLIWRMRKIPLDLYGRFALFDSDDFNSRLYAYENDVLYSFSVPAYFNQGIRWYFLAKYELTDYATLEGRIAQFKYPFEESISSGTEEILGNTRTDVTIQLRVRM